MKGGGESRKMKGGGIKENGREQRPIKMYNIIPGSRRAWVGVCVWGGGGGKS